MNVLVMSFTDSGGGCGRLARAIDELDGHNAIAVRWRVADFLKYDVGFDIKFQPDTNETVKLIQWADAIIVSGPWFDVPYKFPWGTNCIFPQSAPRKPVVVNYRGTPYRNKRKKYDVADKKNGFIQTGNFLDLTLYGNSKEWLPVPYWTKEYERYRDKQNNGKLNIVQVCTKPKRFHLKGIPTVKKQLSEFDNVSLDVVTNLSNAECLNRMGKADLVITAFNIGFGNAGLEAMSMGIPIIADGFDELITKYEETIGYLPFIKAKLNDIGYTASNLTTDKLDEYAELGCSYVKQWHDPVGIGKFAIELCKKAGA